MSTTAARPSTSHANGARRGRDAVQQPGHGAGEQHRHDVRHRGHRVVRHRAGVVGRERVADAEAETGHPDDEEPSRPP